MTDAITIISRYSMRHVYREATLDDTFRDLCLDSIDVTCIAMDVDEAFGCELPDEDVEKWSSVADVATTIAELAKEHVA